MTTLLSVPATLGASLHGSMFFASFGSVVLGWTMFILSLFLILLILVQRGKGGGLAGALGGPGGQSAFGSKAGDTFTLITAVTAIIWGFVCAVAMYTLGVPPVIADDEYDFEDPPALVSPDESAGGAFDPTGGASGLSGLSGLADQISGDGEADSADADADPADDADTENDQTPSAELGSPEGDGAESGDGSEADAESDEPSSESE